MSVDAWQLSLVLLVLIGIAAIMLAVAFIRMFGKAWRDAGRQIKQEDSERWIS